MTYYYFTLALGILIIALMVLTWVKRKELQQSPWYAAVVLTLVCVQDAFGARTVMFKLQPTVMMTHLLLGMSLLAALIWLGCENDAPRTVGARDASLYMVAVIGFVLLVIQIVLGGWVSINYTVLACTDFPLCDGQWVPSIDFAHGSTSRYQLGKTAGGNSISYDALVTIHWTHRVFAVVVLSYLAWLGVHARCIGSFDHVATVLLVVLAMQLVTELSNIVLGRPLLVVVVHNGGAAILLLLMVRLYYLIGLA